MDRIFYQTYLSGLKAVSEQPELQVPESLQRTESAKDGFLRLYERGLSSFPYVDKGKGATVGYAGDEVCSVRQGFLVYDICPGFHRETL